ncbi:hypothetical protein HL658_27340 [Azospirillum sp. RWY-5-1]|uniref:Rap1a immunity protein domain-containing protein n=1 Tax=Azospirillum oleiclasticum TaxID=2735135 RepID=A0ABX2THC6_9PROT|nr:hypothetical protein [Azospirillum oleiclasticum]NYZ16272.1 hypothetical protein [Azospirillum oleiclasticum]NYZ23759.1 hypothetical protein [Azospirillum oleiclasticum]
MTVRPNRRGLAALALAVPLLLPAGGAFAQFKDQYDHLDAIGRQGRTVFVSGFTVAAISVQGACRTFDGAMCATQDAIVRCWEALSAEPGSRFVEMGVAHLEDLIGRKDFSIPVGAALIDTYASACRGGAPSR